MPTEPLAPLLDRAVSKAEAEPVLRVADPLLRELVNYATVAFDRCQSSSIMGGQDEDLAPLILFLHVIEMADGVHVLLRETCTGAAMPSLRSLFEAELYLDFLLRGSDPERRLAWLVDAAVTRIERLERYDPIRKSDAKRRRKKGLPGPTSKERWLSDQIRKEIKSLKDFLRLPHIAPVATRVAAGRTWYQPYGGGGNLEQLANNLGRGEEYQKLYRHWSGISHPSDLWRFVSATPEGTAAFGRLRAPEPTREIASLASAIFLRAIRQMVDKYCPGERDALRTWYQRKVQPRFRLVSGAIAP